MEKDLKIELPVIANILPLIGFVGGAALGYYLNKNEQDGTKRIVLISVCGLMGSAICSVPKAILIDKAVKEHKQTLEAASSASQPNIKSGAWDNDTRTSATSKDVIDALRNLVKGTPYQNNFEAKIDYFYDLVNYFNQDEKDCMVSLLQIVDRANNDDDSAEQLKERANELMTLETEYGKEFVDRINARMDEMVNHIQDDNLTPVI